MPTVTKPNGDFTNNVDVADATKVNAQMNTLYNAVNGGLDGANVPNLGDMTTVPTTAKKSADAITEIWNYPFSSITRNALFNGGFAVNQRVVSGTVTLAAGAYGHDRWKAGAGGCTYTFSTVNNVTTITITAGSLIQVIEGIHLYSGTYTLSWTGTAQGKIGTGSFSASGVTGAVTGGTNLSIEFNLGTLSNVQFNIGSIKLPFQPRSYAEELALCRRYYWQLPQDSTYARMGIGFASNTVNANILIKHPVQMRVNPTLVYSAVGDFELSNDSVAYAVTALSLSSATSNKENAIVAITVASGLTANAPYWLEYSGATAGKKIGFDSEI